MTTEALRHLIELLSDTADYATGLQRPMIAAELAGAADAARLLLAEERAAARRARRGRRTPIAA